MHVAAAVADYLGRAGIRRVYGVPGEDHLRLLDALAAADLHYVGARDESAACVMAMAEAQATGRPGVAIVTLAPGLTNAINGIAAAALDHVPLLIISGQHAPDRQPLIVRQGLDNAALVAGVTKWRAVAGARINQLLAKALDTALAPPAGPVYLEVRDDVARTEAVDRRGDWPLLVRSEGAAAHAAVGAALQAAIRQAERPAIIVGARAADPGTADAVQRLAEALHAPVFTSPAAKGVCTLECPWFAGTFLNGNPEAAVLDRCDLILVVGLDALDFFNAPWRYGARVLGIEPDATNAQHFLPVREQIVGDVAAVLDALRAGVHTSSSSVWTVGEVVDYRAHLEHLFALDEGRLTIPAALADARASLPPETLVTVDAGFGKPLAAYLWPACAPRTYFTAHGLSTMGYAIPAANAVQLVHPERPVLGLMGDGSLLMRASEIGVAAALGIAPIYVVWVDASLTQIEIKQRRQGLQPVGAVFPAPCCAKIADAFGGQGWDVETRADFRAALHAARESHQPALIGARVDQAHREAWFDQLRG